MINHHKAIQNIKKIIVENGVPLSSVVSYLYNHFSHYTWVGIYIVDDNKLKLGPWKGERATEHTTIPIGEGICGSAAQSGNTEIVPNVSEDDRYLACFPSTKSEIAVPIRKNNEIVGEIDIDSDRRNAFTREDRSFLEEVAALITPLLR